MEQWCLDEGRGMGTAEFSGPCVCLCISVVVEGVCVRDGKGLEVCTVGTVG
jgi:hypothetical protein